MHLNQKAGFSRKTAQAGAVTLIQRFGSALNLNVHFQMVFLDGVYIERPDGVPPKLMRGAILSRDMLGRLIPILLQLPVGAVQPVSGCSGSAGQAVCGPRP